METKQKPTYAPKGHKPTSIQINTSVEGETLEQKFQRMLQSKEPIKDGAPIIFTDKKDGVLPAYNIRTDRFEVAVEGMDKVYKMNAAKRDEKAQKSTNEEPKVIEIGEPKSIQAPDGNPQ